MAGLHGATIARTTDDATLEPRFSDDGVIRIGRGLGENRLAIA